MKNLYNDLENQNQKTFNKWIHKHDGEWIKIPKDLKENDGCNTCAYHCYLGLHSGLCIKNFKITSDKHDYCDFYEYGQCIGNIDDAIVDIIEWAEKNNQEEVFEIIKKYLEPVPEKRF